MLRLINNSCYLVDGWTAIIHSSVSNYYTIHRLRPELPPTRPIISVVK